MKAFTVLSVALLGLAGLSMAEEAKAEDLDLSVKTYDADKFKAGVAEKNNFVMFYAPWCGHCKRLHPTWEDLAVKYNDVADSDVTIAKVDCTVETALCSEHEVSGYPTLKFFVKGEDLKEAEKYRGQRDMAALTKFINKKTGVESEEEEVVGEPEIATADKGLYVLNEKSFNNHVKQGDHFVKFYAPWCGHCQKLAPIWDELAANFADSKVAKISKLDCTGASGICQSNEVKGYPTLAYFRNGKKMEVYRGARNLKELTDFVNSMTEDQGAASAGGDKDKVPTEDAKAGAVAKLGTDNFDATIKSGVTFVKFFAPWCGHCKRLAPTWEQLAEQYENEAGVTIAHVDCTSDDNKNKQICNDQGVKGFPTLIAFKDGEKAEEYNGKRELDDLKAFVKKVSGKAAKDEL